jgi:hypothetical protein
VSGIPPAVRQAATAVAAVEDAAAANDPLRLSKAEAHALGFFRRGYKPASLVEVTGVSRENENLPSSLQPWMVPGAEIDPALVTAEAITAGPRGGAVRMGQLREFLATRDYHGLSDLSWATAARAVQHQLQFEENLQKKAEENNEDMQYHLRDPSGRTLAQFFLEQGIVALENYAQYDDATFIVDDVADFISDIYTIRNTAPYFTEATIQEHFRHLLHSTGDRASQARVLERAFQRIGNLHRVELEYNPKPMASRADIVTFRMKVPASFGAHKYLVTIWCKIDTNAKTLGKPVEKVRRACIDYDTQVLHSCEFAGTHTSPQHRSSLSLSHVTDPPRALRAHSRARDRVQGVGLWTHRTCPHTRSVCGGGRVVRERGPEYCSSFVLLYPHLFSRVHRSEPTAP